MENKKDILKTVTRHAQAGEWLKVIKEYDKLIKMDPADISLYNSMGDALVKLGENRKAFEYYAKVLDEYKKKGVTKKIPFLYKKIAKLNPRKFDLEGKDLHKKISKIVQATSYFDKEDYTRAFPALKEASKLDSKNADIMAKLGEAAEHLTQIGEASEAYSKAIKLYIEKERPDEALDIAKKVLKLDRDNVEASGMIAEDKARKGKKEEAADMFRDILITLAENNDVKKGIEISQRAKDLDVEYGKQFYAYFLFKDGKVGEAKKQLESGYDLTPEEKILLGKIYFKSGEFDRAKDVLMSLDPEIINENEEIMEQIADIFLKKREDKKAGEFYLKACRRLKEKDMLDAAVGMAYKVQNVDPDNIGLYRLMADVYAKKNMKKQLIDSYEKLAVLLEKDGNSEEALQARQTLQKLKML